MRIFNLARGEGKTIRMLYASEFSNAPILCRTGASKAYIMDMAKRHNINIPEPITLCDVTNKKLVGKRIGDIFVDDAEWVLRDLLAHLDLNMVGGTVTVQKE